MQRYNCLQNLSQQQPQLGAALRRLEFLKNKKLTENESLAG